MKQAELFENSNQHGHCLRTYRAYSLRVEAQTSPPSWPKWGSVGITEHGECWTRNGSEWPSAAEGSSACSLASILEPSVASKYFLSAKACAGILRRAEKRGKELPEALRAALMAVAATERNQEPTAKDS